MNNLLDRQRGCLLGLANGDALGVPAEFKPRGSFEPITDYRGGGAFYLAPGEWTDDMSMGLCLGDALLALTVEQVNAIRRPWEAVPFGEAINEFAIDLHSRFYRWYDRGENSHNGRCFDIGNTTRRALDRGKTLVEGKYAWPEHREDEASNGSVMRLAAAAIRFSHDPDTAELVGGIQGQVTHGNHLSITACNNLGRFLVTLMHADSVYAGAYEAAAMSGLEPQRLVHLDEKSIQSSGYIVDTMDAALWALLTTDNYKDCVLRAVNLGDDADTVGAVAGQMAGAHYGRSAIPVEWIEKMAWSQRIDDMAVSLAAASLADQYSR